MIDYMKRMAKIAIEFDGKNVQDNIDKIYAIFREVNNDFSISDEAHSRIFKMGTAIQNVFHLFDMEDWD